MRKEEYLAASRALHSIRDRLGELREEARRDYLKASLEWRESLGQDENLLAELEYSSGRVSGLDIAIASISIEFQTLIAKTIGEELGK